MAGTMELFKPESDIFWLGLVSHCIASGFPHHSFSTNDGRPISLYSYAGIIDSHGVNAQKGDGFFGAVGYFAV